MLVLLRNALTKIFRNISRCVDVNASLRFMPRRRAREGATN
ncbi:hypothetical protein FBZ93_109300 [Bradyrhizobium macuxiense]|uniref:Uncharacterized protein n=1 Tax=Bradyrhizobium macuxiense TaxID=1755647 RepID=A0A560LNE9_9BRAD|nr:hypothetical protein FBZ93_109300 [Bradyrhizobium macuxiense]